MKLVIINYLHRCYLTKSLEGRNHTIRVVPCLHSTSIEQSVGYRRGTRTGLIGSVQGLETRRRRKGISIVPLTGHPQMRRRTKENPVKEMGFVVQDAYGILVR